MMPRGYIDLRNPLNRAHPLNRGLVARWMALPGWMGGRQFFDLCGLNPGVLTNMTSASVSGWKPTTRPGGYGHLLFDGVDDYVNIARAVVAAGEPLTFTCWAWSATNGGYDTLVDFTTLAAGDKNYYLRRNADNTLGCGVRNSDFGQSGNAVTSTTIGSGVWYHAAAIFTSTTSRTVYLNAGGAGTNTTTVTVPSGMDHTFIGAYGSSGSPLLFTNGRIDDISIYSVAKSAAEVAADYAESLQGRPETLNWSPSGRVISIPASVQYSGPGNFFFAA